MNAKSKEPGVLLVAILLPTLVTVGYFVLAAGSPAAWQQAVYAVGKLVQFAMPAVWIWLVLPTPPRWNWGTAKWLGVGAVFGLVVMLVTGGAYFALKEAPFLTGMAEGVKQKVAAIGIQSPGQMILLGVFYSLIHSLLEEYYWRWFVFGRLRDWLSVPVASGISAAGFMLHHVVVLGIFLQDSLWLAGLLSLAVMIGGWLWAWLYHRSDSLLGPWISHLLVDAGIFFVGYHMVFA